MSVYPLSAAQREGLALDPDRVVESPERPPGSIDESKLDAAVSKAFEQVESQYEEHPQEKDLDKLISKSIEAHEARVAEEERHRCRL
jgi:hypothetical protein